MSWLEVGMGWMEVDGLDGGWMEVGWVGWQTNKPFVPFLLSSSLSPSFSLSLSSARSISPYLPHHENPIANTVPSVSISIRQSVPRQKKLFFYPGSNLPPPSLGQRWWHMAK